MTSREELADALIAEVRRRKLSEPRPPLVSDAEREADLAAIAAARELALPLVDSVRPYLTDDSLRFLDVYASADEWEFIIGLATQTAVAEGVPVPPKVLEYEEWMGEGVVELLRQRFATT